VQHGLAVNRQTVNQLVWGRQRKGSPFHYVAPDFRQDVHNSLSPAWRALEYLPKSDRYREWPGRTSLLGHYIPDGEPRSIPRDAFLHQSVLERMGACPAYRPVNLPETYRVVPMQSGPCGAH
jgi:hypothetical protein